MRRTFAGKMKCFQSITLLKVTIYLIKLIIKPKQKVCKFICTQFIHRYTLATIYYSATI